MCTYVIPVERTSALVVPASACFVLSLRTVCQDREPGEGGTSTETAGTRGGLPHCAARVPCFSCDVMEVAGLSG
jgi:hypothetical protein